MKQRVKLSLNLFFQLKAHLFDEPCAHLDQAGYAWFNHHVSKVSPDSAVVIASNDPAEYLHAKEEIRMEQFKNL
jgi:energy-coupling factor transporter ATP-binding protein EcfA2